MPRETIELPGTIEHLSVLDEDGNLDQDLEPSIPEDKLLQMHRAMLLARRFDERMLSLQRQGRIGTFAPVKGQEASQVGAAAALKEKDWVVPAFRETAVNVWRGIPLDGMLLFNAGFNEGGAIPEDQNDLPIAIPVASQIPHAAGIAYGIKYREKRKKKSKRAVVMTFFGDGATSEGDFHEALNFAGVLQLGVIFLCQNNQWAISIPREHQTKSKTLAQKALAYGIPGVQVDGNDVLAVYAAAQEAAKRARSGDGPTMIECVTYRMEVHTTADDPKKYRDEEEVEEWQERDPLSRFQAYLKDKDVISGEKMEDLEDEIKNEIDEAWEQTQQKMEELSDDPLVMFDHIYEQLPEYLRTQKEQVAEVVDGNGKEERA